MPPRILPARRLKVYRWVRELEDSTQKYRVVAAATAKKYAYPRKRILRLDSSECPVCLDTYQNGEFVRRTPCCRQSLHSDCFVNQWLRGQFKRSCPLCRHLLLPRFWTSMRAIDEWARQLQESETESESDGESESESEYDDDIWTISEGLNEVWSGSESGSESEGTRGRKRERGKERLTHEGPDDVNGLLALMPAAERPRSTGSLPEPVQSLAVSRHSWVRFFFEARTVRYRARVPRRNWSV